MQSFEYKVVPAPKKGKKARGAKTPAARFALGVEIVLNEMAVAGWEYVRAEILPSEERSGLTSSKTHSRNLLVFRRPIVIKTPDIHVRDVEAPAVVARPHQTPVAPAPAVSAPSPQAVRGMPNRSTAAPVSSPHPVSPPYPAPEHEPPILTATAGDPMAPPEAKPVPGLGARQMISDDGVEEVSPVLGITAALKARARKGHSD